VSQGKKTGESPSHSRTLSYTTASTLLLLHTTHHLCQPKAAKPNTSAAISPVRTSTVTKNVSWLHFGHKAALDGCSLATTKRDHTRRDSGMQLRPRASTAQLPVACTQMVRETSLMDSPAVIRQRQAPGQPCSSWDWNRHTGNTAPAGTDGPSWTAQAPGPRQEHGQDPGETKAHQCRGVANEML